MHAHQEPIIIVGGGLAGLQCASTLHQHNQTFVLIEKQDYVGGRLATTKVDGYCCDRGFQVLPSGDPEVRRHLPLDALHLGQFMSGALVRMEDQWHHLADPRRHPQHAFEQCFGRLGTLTEKVRLLRWMSGMFFRGPGPIPTGTSIGEEIDSLQINGSLSELFLKPWLRGITCDPELRADAGAVKAYVSAFMRGPAVLPRHGMASIPTTMAGKLPQASLRLGQAVTHLSAKEVTLSDSTTISGAQVILATDAPAQADLLETQNHPPGLGVSALHVALPAPAPLEKPWLVLPGDCPGPIASVSFPSLVNPSYAPEGWHLATIAVLNGGTDEQLWPAVQTQLQNLFQIDISAWRLLKTDHIPMALPAQTPEHLSPGAIKEQAGMILCGDCQSRPGIGAALASGHAAAMHALKMLSHSQRT